MRLFKHAKSEEVEEQKRRETAEEQNKKERLFLTLEPEETGIQKKEANKNRKEQLFTKVEAEEPVKFIKELVETPEPLTFKVAQEPIRSSGNEYVPAVSGLQYPTPAYKPFPASNVVPASTNQRKVGGKIRGDIAEFQFSQGGLYAYDIEGRQIYLSNFCVEILEEKTVVEEIIDECNDVIGANETIFWRVRIRTSDKVYEGWVENDRLLELKWIGQISGNRGRMEDAPSAKSLFRTYLNRLITEEGYQMSREYTSAGWKWTKEDRAFFLTSDGPIGNYNMSLKACKGFELPVPIMDCRSALCEFLRMREILSGNLKNAATLQYYLPIALCTSLFKKAGHQIEFVMALIGKTNTKKTTCGEIFTRIYKRMKNAVPDINFSATQAAIYEIMGKMADTVVLIDDLTPSENDRDAREKIHKLESIIRAYGDRVPRKRSTAYAPNASIKEFTPVTGCALITGETFVGGKSSRSRALILSFEDGDVNDDTLSYFQKNLYVLPAFAYYFLQYVTKNINVVMETIERECASAREMMKKRIQMPRYVDTYGVYCAITQIVRDFIVSEHLLDCQSAEKMKNQDRSLIMEVILENDSDVSYISPGVTIMQALNFALKENAVHICDLDQATGNEDLKKTIFLFGDYFCIQSESLWQCAKEYTDYRRIYFPFKCGKDIIRPLDAESLLMKKKEGETVRSSHKLSATVHTGKRFLFLRKEKVLKIWKELDLY